MPAPPRDTESTRAHLAAMLPELREEHGVRSLAIFGSYARGEQTATSDLDILADFERTPSLFDLVAVALDLEDALGVRVDLSMPDELKARVRPHVMRYVVSV